MELIEGVRFNLHLHRKPVRAVVPQRELRAGTFGIATSGTSEGRLVYKWTASLLSLIEPGSSYHDSMHDHLVQPFTTSDALTLIFK